MSNCMETLQFYYCRLPVLPVYFWVNIFPCPSSSLNFPPNDSWNLDLPALEYSVSRKDMSDAKIHHLLAEELYKPTRRVRRRRTIRILVILSMVMIMIIRKNVKLQILLYLFL